MSVSPGDRRERPPAPAVTAPASRTRLRWLAPAALGLVLSAVYAATLLPGAGYSPDTAEMQFSGHLLAVTHPTGYPIYLLLSYAFSRLVPIGSVALRANLLSAICSVLACLVLRRVLLRLGAREAVATALALALGFTPTFWRLSLVAEVYSLHALFLAAVADGMLRWRQTGKRGALVLACGLCVASFGNHLTTVTLLPALAFMVLATRPRVLFDVRATLPICGLIVLGLLLYVYPVWRSLDAATPYLAARVTNLTELWSYATGASFHSSMFSFSPRQVLHERLPLVADHWWADCGVLLPLAAVGMLSFRDRVAGAFLGLMLTGQLVFALSYDIADIEVYFIPVYLVTAIVAGVAAERLLSLRGARRVPALLCLALPLSLCLLHWDAVVEARGADKAEPMRELLEETRDGALIVARYNDYMYLLYFTLAGGLGGPSVYVANDVSVPEIVAYLREGRPVYLAPTRRWAPAGLPVYCTQLDLRRELKAAGVQVTMTWPGVFRIEEGRAPSGVIGPPAPDGSNRVRPPE